MTRATGDVRRRTVARPGLLTALVVLATASGAGYAAAVVGAPVLHNRYFPWIVGRSLGLAAYLCMAALVAVGIWMRHPWRFRRPLVHAETALRYHAALGAAAVVLVAGHLVSLASDKYAGVGWTGALLPGHSAYRPLPVAIGVSACWGLLLVAGTARIGGRLVGRAWLPVHRLAMPVFAAVFVHGVLAGTDTVQLRAMYVATGGGVLVLWATRYLASPSAARAARPAPLPASLPGDPEEGVA